MIQSIDNRAALPTDATMALKAPQRGHRFSTALENAQQDSPKTAPQSRPAATQELQNRAVSRRPAPEAAQEREATGAQAAKESASSEAQRPASETSDERQPGRADESQTTETERRERHGEEAAAAGAMPDGTALRVPAQPQPATAQQLAAGQPREGLVLATPQGEQTLAQGYAPSGRIGSTLDAQLGRAAYNFSPHGVGEPVQPTAYAAAPSAGAIAAMKPADPAQQGIQMEPHVVNVQEMVQLSNAARSAMVASQTPAPKTAADTAEPKRDVARGDASSAQARNQLLAQIGGATGAVAATTQATGSNPNAGQGDAGLSGNRGQASMPVKDVKPASTSASGPALPVDGTAAGLAAGAATAGAVHQARDGQPVADSGQRFDPAMMNKIVQESRWLIRTGHSEVTLKLQPENLGEMKLKVTHKDGDLTVQMTVDSAAAKHMLDANLKELRQQLQSENLAQGNLLLNVDVRQGGDPGGFTGFAKTAAQQGHAQPVGTPAAEDAPQVGRAQPAAWGNSNISIYA